MTWSAKTCQTPSDTEINISADKIRRIFVWNLENTYGKGTSEAPIIFLYLSKGKTELCAGVRDF